jgi:hypothetical protein
VSEITVRFIVRTWDPPSWALPSGEPTDQRVGDAFYAGGHEPGYEHCPWTNCDGKHLFVITPGGWWNIDGRCSNCDKKDDRLHRCWVRHGDPAAGTLHVDKNGLTCGAGAGSIQADGYHGFLHNGRLVSC